MAIKTDLIKQIFWLMLGCYFSVGCAPIYRTDYSFTPPTTSEGKKCASQCDLAQLQCKQMADMIYENCELRAEIACDIEYRRSCREHRKGCDYSRRPFCHKPLPFCSANYSRCETYYRSCYETCGGKVTAKKVCVLGCKNKKAVRK